MTSLRERIYSLPKAEFHNHLYLGGNIKLIEKKYGDSTPKIPNQYNGFDGMMSFIQKDLNKILLTSNDVIFFMEAGLKSCIEDNISYLEASVDLNLVRFFNGSIEKLIETTNKLKAKYSSQLTFRPDIGIKKDLNIREVFNDVSKCFKSGVFHGVDIYGREANQNLDGFVEIFNMAREENLKTKVHIGEFSESKTIEDAIKLLNPDEIQHGIKAADSLRTMDMILENDIRLNISPQSNIALGSVENILEHPLRKLYNHGIKITINTDDFLLFNTSLTDQYLELIENNIFSFEEIRVLIKNGFN